GSQVHYAAVNARDDAFMRAAGFHNVHLLPNPVEVPGAAEAAHIAQGVAASAHAFDFVGPGQRLYLYPTRGIRRKNLGEFLLWAAVSPADADAVYATTLAPDNPAARDVYTRWRAFAHKLRLPAVF